MEKAADLTAKAFQQGRFAKPPNSSQTSTQPNVSNEIKRMVAAVFTKMRLLDRGKAAADFRVRDESGAETVEFRVWCKEIGHLTPAQFAQGIKIMEQQEADARRTGDESWPPSYAGFIGIATMQLKSRSTVEALPASILSRDEAREKFAELRAMLGDA